MVTLKEMVTKSDMKKFVKFPFSLYKDSKYWIPPIINDEIANFNKNENPIFEHAEARFFIALDNKKIVGRVAAIINWTEVNQQKIKKMRFGWFDFIDNKKVSKILLDKVIEIGKENSLEFIEGPVGFSNLDKTGVLIKGFDVLGTMVTWYNHPYYKEHLESLGFIKEKEWLENSFLIKDINAENFTRLSNLIQKRYKLKPLSFTKTKQVLPYVEEMFALFNETYKELASFVPISDSQVAYMKKKFIKYIHPEFIKFVADENGKLVAFTITMPSFSKALQKANGKLFPMGLFYLLQAQKSATDVVFYLIGIHPKYHNKGVNVIIFDEYYKTYTKLGITRCIRTPELEENKAIKALWKNFNPKIIKRRRTYKKTL